MSGSRTTIPEWEIRQLRAITDGATVQEREAALLEYLTEREQRRRYAKVRNRADRQRRTLVGAHMRLEEAERVQWLANLAGMSVTAYVKRAIALAGKLDVTDQANVTETEDERRLARGLGPTSWAISVRR